MAKIKPQPTTSTPLPEYRPPQKLLGPCPHCGYTVLWAVSTEGRVKTCTPVRDPVFGDDHRCQVAVYTVQRMQGVHLWQNKGDNPFFDL